VCSSDLGKPRETHLIQAIEAIDFDIAENVKTNYTRKTNQSNQLIQEEHFTTNLIICESAMKNDYSMLDSFIIMLFTKGAGILTSGIHQLPYQKGELILLPANTETIEINPSAPTEMIEVFV